MLLSDYAQQVKCTDRLSSNDLQPVLMGLFGEVGSIMATAKKYLREKSAYAGYRRAVEEEFGDALWYFNALCQRLGVGIQEVLSDAVKQGGYDESVVASHLPDGPIAHVSSASSLPADNQNLMNLGIAAAALLHIKDKESTGETRDLLRVFADRYLQALQASTIDFANVVRMNIDKTRGRFLHTDPKHLPTFDSEFPEEERLPLCFEIRFKKRNSGKCHLQWKGVFIGDPLTDNISNPDGYRFHDVFHFAYAAILHWSPVFRALIKQKRKSDPKVDEEQDGGRAIVVEEGLTAWIFARAKDLDLFAGQETVSFGLLKVVQEFVQGYEVERCPLKLWERAILDGYEVFRQLRKHEGGVVVGNREARTIEYKEE